MKKDFLENLAYSMEICPELLPYLPELLAGFWNLGSFPEMIIKILKPLRLPGSQTEVLDLGCGKGAISVTLAKELGYYITGVDGIEAFLEVAKEKARELQVEKQCCFIRDDIREYVQTASNYDLVILASVGNVLGNLSQTVAILRNTIKDNGYMLIDDGFLKKEKQLNQTHYNSYRNQSESLEQLASSGDRIIQELILPDKLFKEKNDQYMRWIKNKATYLMREKPELKILIKEYIDRQEEECSYLENHFTCAMWLIQKKK